MTHSEYLLQVIGEVNDEAVRDARFGGASHRSTLRKFVTAALVAVLMLSMSITAAGYFGGAEWLRAFFADSSGQALTDRQQQYIDDQTVGIGQSITHNDCTVTVTSAITDGRNAYVVLQIAMPDGTILDASSYYFEDFTFKGSNPVRHPVGTSGCGWPLLEDGNAKDNNVSVMMSMFVTVPEGSGFSYADGYERTLVLRNLCTRQTEYPYEQITVAEGEWTFHFTLTGDDREIELLTAPVTLTGQRMMGEPFRVPVHSVRMTSMGLICSYTFFPGDTPESTDFGAAVLTMKDGTAVGVYPKSGGISGTPEGGYDRGECMYCFAVPIELSDADYLEFSDGTRIEIP